MAKTCKYRDDNGVRCTFPAGLRYQGFGDYCALHREEAVGAAAKTVGKIAGPVVAQEIIHRAFTTFLGEKPTKVSSKARGAEISSKAKPGPKSLGRGVKAKAQGRRSPRSRSRGPKFR